jgi:hypothetical protein
MSEEAVKILGLKVKSHMDPYHVPWATNTMLKVDKHCQVTPKNYLECHSWLFNVAYLAREKSEGV